LFARWIPGESGLLPATDEAYCAPTIDWGYYWFVLAELHGCQFESGGENFVCYVTHAPTRCNYWHFELHFHNQHGDVYYLESKQRRKVAPRIRAWLQDYALAYPPAAALAVPKWPEDVYMAAATSMPD
jgi:hypothetical protein